MSSSDNKKVDPGFATIIGAAIGAIALIVGTIMGTVVGAKSQPIQVFLGSNTPTIVAQPDLPGLPSPQPTYTMLPTYTPQQAYTALPTYTLQPTYTALPTYTPFPTYTSYPEPTSTLLPSAIPLPAISLPFEDTFDLRPRPEWKLEGKWRVVNGTLCPDEYNTWIYAFVGDENWNNYSVHVYICSCPSRPFQLIVRRVEESDSSMIVQLNMQYELYSKVQFILHRASQDTQIGPATVIGGAGCKGQRYRIDVRDDIYSFFEGDKLILRIQDSMLKAGKVGIGVNASGPDSCFDNFMVTELP